MVDVAYEWRHHPSFLSCLVASAVVGWLAGEMVTGWPQVTHPSQQECFGTEEADETGGVCLAGGFPLQALALGGGEGRAFEHDTSPCTLFFSVEIELWSWRPGALVAPAPRHSLPLQDSAQGEGACEVLSLPFAFSLPPTRLCPHQIPQGLCRVAPCNSQSSADWSHPSWKVDHHSRRW